MILEQLKKQFESISIDFKLKNDVIRLDASILCKQFNYLDVALKVEEHKRKCFAVTLDSSPNSIILVYIVGLWTPASVSIQLKIKV